MKTNLLVFIVTAYCHCARCCGEAGQPTASGYMPREGVTVAGPEWLKFGTLVNIEGVGLRRIDDRMAPRFRKGKFIDVFLNSHSRAKKFGKKKLIVKI